MIEGKPYGQQPSEPMEVPSIDELLNRRRFKSTMLVPIQPEEFDAICKYVLEREDKGNGE